MSKKIERKCWWCRAEEFSIEDVDPGEEVRVYSDVAQSNLVNTIRVSKLNETAGNNNPPDFGRQGQNGNELNNAASEGNPNHIFGRTVQQFMNTIKSLNMNLTGNLRRSFVSQSPLEQLAVRSAGQGDFHHNTDMNNAQDHVGGRQEEQNQSQELEERDDFSSSGMDQNEQDMGEEEEEEEKKGSVGNDRTAKKPAGNKKQFYSEQKGKHQIKNKKFKRSGSDINILSTERKVQNNSLAIVDQKSGQFVQSSAVRASLAVPQQQQDAPPIQLNVMQNQSSIV